MGARGENPKVKGGGGDGRRGGSRAESCKRVGGVAAVTREHREVGKGAGRARGKADLPQTSLAGWHCERTAVLDCKGQSAGRCSAQRLAAEVDQLERLRADLADHQRPKG